MTRYTLGSTGYRLHVFHRGDIDQDCHDHPWSFWTFPLTPYVEEVWHNGHRHRANVAAGEWHFRPATYTHRVIGPQFEVAHPHTKLMRDVMVNVCTSRRGFPWYTRLAWWWFGTDKIVTIVKTGPVVRKWGFQRAVGKAFVWTPWREYLAKVRSWMD